MFDEVVLYNEVNRRFKQLNLAKKPSPIAEFMIKQSIRNEVKVEMLTKHVENAEKALAAYKQKIQQNDGETYEEIMNQAFSKDPEEAFQGSIKLARMNGVPEDQILKSKEDIDKFFLGE